MPTQVSHQNTRFSYSKSYAEQHIYPSTSTVLPQQVLHRAAHLLHHPVPCLFWLWGPDATFPPWRPKPRRDAQTRRKERPTLSLSYPTWTQAKNAPSTCAYFTLTPPPSLTLKYLVLVLRGDHSHALLHHVHELGVLDHLLQLLQPEAVETVELS